MTSLEFSKDFIESLYRVTAFSLCKTDKEKKLLISLCKLSEKTGVSISTILEIVRELGHIADE